METHENITSNNTKIKESEMQLQSSETTTSSTTQLLERNVKQIQFKEESTIKKVLKTREVKHFNSAGQEIPANEFVASNHLDLGNHDDSTTTASTNVPNTHQSSNNTQFKSDTESNQNHSTLTDSNIDPILANPVNIKPPPPPPPPPPPSSQRNAALQNHNSPQSVNEPLYDSRSHQQNSNNYQNLMSDNTSSANLTGLFSTIQNEYPFHQPVTNLTQNHMQQPHRSNSRNSNIHPSGYEELDSTLGLTNAPQAGLRGAPINNLSGSAATVGHFIPIKPTTSVINQNHQSIMVQPDYIHQSNGVAYASNRSNYDMAYGTTGPAMVQMPMLASNASIYGTTRSIQEPIYAINRNGSITLVAQPNIDDGSEIRWRNPELEEVIGFFSSPDPTIRANSIAYLQHLSYNDDKVKQRTRLLGAIPILIDLLNRDLLEVQRKVCGALRNLSFGRQNDDNKRAIRDSSGIQALVNTLVSNPDNEIRELATSVLWNLSSCEDVKWTIVDDALDAIITVIIVPYTEWFKANLSNAQQFLPTASETHWSTVFRNATGVIRNISSAGAHARKQLRDCEGLVDSLFFIINASINRNDVENKLVENCVCILRNLSFRCQETQDPDYDKHYYSAESASNSMQNSPSSPSSSSNLTSSLVGQVSENLGCFSFGRRSKSKSRSSLLSARNNNSKHSQAEPTNSSGNESRATTLLPPHHPSNLQVNGQSSTMMRTSTQVNGFVSSSATLPRSSISAIHSGVNNPNRPYGKDLLWQPDVVKPYLALLSGCSNSETLEAAAGAIQNLAACFWQPSINIRAAVRKERGLPVLVELLRMDRDRVVCVVATALRNLAIDQKNKELIGKYAMPDLVNKLSGDQDSPASDDTIAAVLATLHEVISNNADFVRSLYESGGLNKLTHIVKNRSKYSTRVQRFAAQVLLDMWKFTELRELFKKGGWKESNFIVRQQLSGKSSTYSVNSNTIERPIASQQADRSSSVRNLRAISTPIPLDASQINVNSAMNLSQTHDVHPTYGTVQMTALNIHVTNPQALYAQVDRQRKRNDGSHQQQTIMMANNNC